MTNTSIVDPIVLEEIDPTLDWVVEGQPLGFPDNNFNWMNLEPLDLLDEDELGVGPS